MKIVHMCVSCFYIDNYRYQENELVRQHVEGGHEVTVIASTETFVDNMTLGYTEPGDYIGSDGARVIRLPYSGPFPFFLKRKLRMHPGVYRILEELLPDVILFHGLCGWELLTVAKYKKNHPEILLWADSHEDAANSGTNYLSRQILHKIYYKNIIQKARPYIHKVLCISLETIEFCHEVYDIPKTNLVFFPLGGRIPTDVEYNQIRRETRALLDFTDRNIVYLQSGKIDKKKRLIDSLQSFYVIEDPEARFIIVGEIAKDVLVEVKYYLDKDSRIKYLGWKKADQLYNLLCAADVYIQPGSQSATMQMSLCARCVIIIADVPSHHPYMKDNGYLISTQQQILLAMQEILQNPETVKVMAENSNLLARKYLDYSKMADQLTHF